VLTTDVGVVAVVDSVVEGGHSKCIFAVLLSLMNVVVLTTTYSEVVSGTTLKVDNVN